MASVPISKFKAQCLAMLENVRKTGQPLRITRFGKPMADIVPAAVHAPASWIGLFPEGELHDDLLAPAAGASEWEALAEATPQLRKRNR
jgi:prevent-host-death family protein